MARAGLVLFGLAALLGCARPVDLTEHGHQETVAQRKHSSPFLTDFAIVAAKHVQHRVQQRRAAAGEGEGEVRYVSIPHSDPVLGINGTLELRLRPDRTSLPYGSVPVTIVDAKGNTRTEHFDGKDMLYEGSVTGRPESRVRLVLYDDGAISGRVHVNGQLLMLEPARRHGFADDESVLLYRADHLRFPDNHPGAALLRDGPPAPLHFCGGHVHPNRSGQDHDGTSTPPLVHVSASQRRQRRASSPLLVCLMTLVVDYRLYAQSGSSMPVVAADVLSYANFVAERFSETTFSSSQSYSIYVKNVIVYESPGSDPYYSATPLPVTDVLNLFSETDWHEVCLAHLFTHTEFDDGVQGLAWIGTTQGTGICDGFGVFPRGGWWNTGLTSSLNFGATVPQLMLTLTFMHELGHNFGSRHDPETTECAPSGSAGRFVMYQSAVDGTDDNNFKFSPCSITSITPVLQARAPVCFQSPPAGICGNGIVEKKGADDILGTDDDEQCDPGFDTSNPCCFSNCTFRPRANCSDDNQACCRDCHHAGLILAANGSVLQAAKQCYAAFDLDTLCRDDTYCTDASFDCPSIEQKPEGTECLHQGTCVANSDPTLRCMSVCSQFGAKTCKCSDSENECRLCCELDTTRDPACPFGYKWEQRAHSNGTIATACFEEGKVWVNDSIVRPESYPFSSTCQLASEILTLPEWTGYTSPQGDPWSSNNLVYSAGKPCTLGLCSADGVCESTEDDFASRASDFFNQFTLEGFRDFMKKHIVGTVMVFSLILWIPVGACMSFKDRRARRELENRLREDPKAVARPRRSHTFEMLDDAETATRRSHNVRSRVAPAAQATGFASQAPPEAWVRESSVA